MIRVTIEIVPQGDESRSMVIGRTIIHNVSKAGQDATHGDYEVAVAHKSLMEPTHAILTRPARRGKVENYPRLSYNIWRLVIRALLSAFPEEHTNKTKENTP